MPLTFSKKSVTSPSSSSSSSSSSDASCASLVQTLSSDVSHLLWRVNWLRSQFLCTLDKVHLARSTLLDHDAHQHQHQHPLQFPPHAAAAAATTPASTVVPIVRSQGEVRLAEDLERIAATLRNTLHPELLGGHFPTPAPFAPIRRPHRLERQETLQMFEPEEEEEEEDGEQLTQMLDGDRSPGPSYRQMDCLLRDGCGGDMAIDFEMDLPDEDLYIQESGYLLVNESPTQAPIGPPAGHQQEQHRQQGRKMKGKAPLPGLEAGAPARIDPHYESPRRKKRKVMKRVDTNRDCDLDGFVVPNDDGDASDSDDSPYFPSGTEDASTTTATTTTSDSDDPAGVAGFSSTSGEIEDVTDLEKEVADLLRDTREHQAAERKRTGGCLSPPPTPQKRVPASTSSQPFEVLALYTKAPAQPPRIVTSVAANSISPTPRTLKASGCHQQPLPPKQDKKQIPHRDPSPSLLVPEPSFPPPVAGPSAVVATATAAASSGTLPLTEVAPTLPPPTTAAVTILPAEGGSDVDVDFFPDDGFERTRTARRRRKKRPMIMIVPSSRRAG